MRNPEPAVADHALALIGLLYDHERRIRKRKLTGESKREYRTRNSLPVVGAFREWCEDQCRRHDLLPSNPLSKALQYAMVWFRWRGHTPMAHLSHGRGPQTGDRGKEGREGKGE